MTVQAGEKGYLKSTIFKDCIAVFQPYMVEPHREPKGFTPMNPFGAFAFGQAKTVPWIFAFLVAIQMAAQVAQVQHPAAATTSKHKQQSCTKQGSMHTCMGFSTHHA
jgi:hypothetical protein